MFGLPSENMKSLNDLSNYPKRVLTQLLRLCNDTVG